MDKGFPSFIGIPVFPSRAFRHSCIYVNTGSGIHEPRDLVGKRVGVPEYQFTMAIWARGILQHEYGVKLEEMKWFTGGQEQPGRTDKIKHDLPKNIDIRPIAPGQTLSSMLERGEIDALISAVMPSPFVWRSPEVRRLIPNFREVERDYYCRTKIFPIMHTVVLRGKFYERYPWVAESLYKGFAEAKRICQESMRDLSALQYMLAWLIAEMEEERDFLGDDPWAYGLQANQHVLNTLVQYSYEQGLIKKRLDLRSLFAPNTLDDFK